jgi:hypothetical protein
MQRIEINIYKRIVRQVGYLLESYRDARSPELISELREGDVIISFTVFVVV